VPLSRVLRERLGKVIECGNYSYLFTRPLAFHRGISVRPRVPYTPYRPFVSLPSLPSSCALQPPSTATVAPSSAVIARRFLTTMAGKSQILPMDTWARSSVMERKMEELVCDGLL
jgi:hypothetical protein